ncbi:glycosyltransferase family 2 protein [Kineothrix sp. MSJ-39]|uniref:glycosyltransferase family 2 protein n=1 Tax=Kineothrix sp. MSJ-39 TaxID=2841533 RepID=UPI002ED0CE26
MELISIIVPVYNVEKYLARCIDSILKQSYSNLEIILIDDGSTDTSGTICDQYTMKDQRIRVVHKKNEGLGYARNSGIELANGKYITFIDSDDYIGEKHIEKMYNLIINTNTDTCLAGHTKVYATHEEKNTNTCSGKVFYGNVAEEILPRMCGADSSGKDYIEMSVCMVLLSNDIIQKNKLRFKSERELISEDLDFDFDYYPLSQGVCVSEIADYYYCDNEGSLTTKYRKNRFDSQVVLYDVILSKAKKLEIEKQCVSRLNTTLIAIARYSIKLEYKFASENGIHNARKNVKNICENVKLQQIMKEYNDKGLRKASKIVNLFIKKKWYFMIEITMKFKNRFSV